MDFDNDEQLRGHAVRLFPSIRISSDREAELRATASLLAIIKAVSEFGRSIVKVAGGPAGRISCYTEVPFKPDDPNAKELRPDGIIRSVRGTNDWRALVEVKVGDNPLEPEQVEAYHLLAKERGFAALITISNQAAQADGLPPVALDGRRLRAIPVVHLSWDRLISEAKLLSQQAEIADADQSWMLEEWIRYFTDPEARIVEPPQLGPHWNEILKAAREQNLPSVAAYVDELVAAWDGYLRKESLRLRAKLGVDVEPVIGRSDRKDPASRAKRMAQEVLEQGCLRGDIRIPDAASEIAVHVNLAAGIVRFGVELVAPQEGRQQTRLNWIAKQLRAATVPEDLVVKVEWDRKNLLSQGRAGDLREEVDGLLRDGRQQLIPDDASPRKFQLEWTRKLQKSKGRSTAPVLEGISSDLEDFYGRVVERLTAYVPPAPKLPKEKEGPVEDAGGAEPTPQIVAAPVDGRASAEASTPEQDLAPKTQVDAEHSE
jgi:hypothetical protein